MCNRDSNFKVIGIHTSEAIFSSTVRYLFYNIIREDKCNKIY